jgi:hypothetical protein
MMRVLVHVGGQPIRTDWVEQITRGKEQGVTTCSVWFSVGSVGAYHFRGRTPRPPWSYWQTTRPSRLSRVHTGSRPPRFNAPGRWSVAGEGTPRSSADVKDACAGTAGVPDSSRSCRRATVLAIALPTE